MKALLQSIIVVIFLLTVFSCPSGYAANLSPDCPCYASINKIALAYQNDRKFRFLIDMAFEDMRQLPEGYREGGNPWIGKGFADLTRFMQEWCTFLPLAKGSSDDGLRYIEQMDFFAYNNPLGRIAFQTSPGRELFRQFAVERGAFLDRPASTQCVEKWLEDPRIEKQDYALPDPNSPDGGFKSYNEFFSRSLKNQAETRPQTMPALDYIIAAPTDALMNSIPVRIVDAKTRLRTKGTQELNIEQLLDGSGHWRKFVGGTALSCILMPNTYHRYHAPVSGRVIETRLVEGALLGMEDFPGFVPRSGNVGYDGADFSAFENYRRGYFIIDTGKYGLVAVVPVGLSTVGSVIFEDRFLKATGPVAVTRGDELGHFLYGGSLVILVFEPGRYQSDAIQVRLGNQIGTFDTNVNE
ncbi:MAG: phosphatidylserine decarboxylase [Proteobacteria bacterium]|nr:phosphatidylserine decarboxylase [Pseudomonadota bacterium]